MHAELRVSYTVPHEIQRLTGRVDASALARRATCLRGILDPRGRRLPWGRSLYRAPVDGHLPRPRSPWPCRPTGLGAATEADADSGEDRPALADREPSAPWLRDRVVDRPTPGPVDPGGVRSPSPPEIPQRLAARPGVHPAEAATRPPRARPEGNRRVVEVRLAAHQEQSPTTGCLHRPERRKWPTDGSAGPPDLVAKSGTREKVSVAAALGLSPRRDRLGLYSHTLANGYFDNWYVTAFLEAMLQELTGRFVVVWDGGSMHKGDPIRALVDHFADRLALEKLPPYAPMLNPVESLWSWLKWERLSNFGPQDA